MITSSQPFQRNSGNLIWLIYKSRPPKKGRLSIFVRFRKYYRLPMSLPSEIANIASVRPPSGLAKPRSRFCCVNIDFDRAPTLLVESDDTEQEPRKVSGEDGKPDMDRLEADRSLDNKANTDR